MAKRHKRGRGRWHLAGRKVSVSKKRGHKPVKLLRFYHEQMSKNLGRLENLIKRREAAGE